MGDEDNDAEDNIVSLAHHRKRKGSPHPDPGLSTARPPTGESEPRDSNRDDPALVSGPVPGRLIWLHCPTCNTLEYTELDLPGGRRHKCGTVVDEERVDIDVRAELTVTEVNLQRIDAIMDYLHGQQERALAYQQRLYAMSPGKVEPYPQDDKMLEWLPVAGVDGAGLLISKALHEPTRRFEPPPTPPPADKRE